MKQLKLGIFFCLIFFVQACVPPSYKAANADVDARNDQFDKNFSVSNMKHADRLPPLVIDNQRNLKAPWLKEKISFHAKGMPLSKLLDRMLQPHGVYNMFGPGVDSNTLVTFDIKGSLQQALNLVSVKTGYAYDIEGTTINWTVFVTKTFDVSFMPGVSKYLVGETNTAQNNNSSNNSNNNSSGNNDLTSSGQFSSIEGNVSLWTDLETTLKTMLSDKGKATISQATTTITVTDYPSNVQQIENYLTKMNQSLSRQVALDIQVLEVNLDDNFLYGIDWGLARNFTHKNYGVDIANTSGSQLNDSLVSTAGTMLMSAKNNGLWNNSKIILNALAQQGKVSVETQPRVVTLNNQVAQIGINTTTTYLAQVSTNVVVNGPTSTTLTPGTVMSGFTLYLLPKIQGDNVYLQISSIISNLVKIQPYPSNASTSVQNGGNQIYAPIVDEKRFNQRTLVPSGATLLLAGFKQMNNTANKNSMFGVDSLGGYGGGKKNIETVILITPSIIHLNS